MCCSTGLLHFTEHPVFFGLPHLIRMENWRSGPGGWSFLCDTVIFVSSFGVEGMSLAKTTQRCELLLICSVYKCSHEPCTWNLLLRRELYRGEPVIKLYLWILLLSSTGTLCSSDFHMKSSVFFTFSANWAARALVLSKHSASFSELRRSMLIKSTVADRSNSDTLIKLSYSLRCVWVSQGSPTIEVRGIAVAWTWKTERCEVGHHFLGRAAVHGWARGEQHHQVKYLEDVRAWLVYREQD